MPYHVPQCSPCPQRQLMGLQGAPCSKHFCANETRCSNVQPLSLGTTWITVGFLQAELVLDKVDLRNVISAFLVFLSLGFIQRRPGTPGVIKERVNASALWDATKCHRCIVYINDITDGCETICLK